MQNTIQDRRLVADYLLALRNEIAVDENALALSGLPNCGRVRLAWQRIGMRGENLAMEPHSEGQILALSSRCGDIVNAEHIQSLPSQWLTLPWAPLGRLPEGAKQMPMLSLLSDEDLDHALKLARYAYLIVHGRPQLRAWGLQTYTAFRWFAVRLAVDKLSGPLLMVEHFDRWAVLVDSSAVASRRKSRPRSLTLMQHGSVGAESNSDSLKVNLPSRLRAVTHLHVYSEADAAIFRCSVLSTNCNSRGVTVSCFRPRIELTKLAAVTKPRILFVGHPLCEALHIRVLNTLLSSRDVLAYYKPHPVATNSGTAIFRQSWTVIEGRVEFPEVDLLVSYPSTMVTEYEFHGITAVVHPIDMEVANAANLVTEIERRLNDINGFNVSNNIPFHDSVKT